MINKELMPKQMPISEQQPIAPMSSPYCCNTLVSGRPERIQRSRQTKQVSPNGLPIIYVGRPSKWGNPFVIDKVEKNWIVYFENGEMTTERGAFLTKQDAVNAAVSLFEQYVSFLEPIKFGKTKEEYKEDEEIFNEFIGELKGKNLSCWCRLDCKCHADVLLELANREAYH